MAILGNEEHKQRLNLSSFAKSVIDMDRGIFDEGGTLSGFLNRIIDQFRFKADASIDEAVSERQYQLIQNGISDDILQKLTDEYRNNLIEKIQAYPQGDSLIFRLNNKNFKFLYEDKAESNNYSAPSKYLKALIEEYTRLSPSERERIYYNELIENVLENAIDTGSILSVKFGQRAFWVKPYSIMADPYNSHLYLVGMSRPEGSSNDESVIASFRITRLSYVARRKHPSGKITIHERKEIEKKIQQVGIQYLIGDNDIITLRLSEAGKREFNQRSYMRPIPYKIEKDIYHFNCTALQIRNYFFSFGANVEVISPDSIRQEFINRYKDALDSYVNSN